MSKCPHAVIKMQVFQQIQPIACIITCRSVAMEVLRKGKKKLCQLDVKF